MSHGKGHKWIRIHYIAAAVWTLLAIPTVLFWAESILWIAFISLYANAVSHIGAAQGARAEEEANGD